jgi:hypothetical protein
MAERIEEPEAATEQALDQASPAAVALALGRTSKGGKVLDAKAAAFLEKQARLIDIQSEHLHEQRELTLSRLRWGRFSDRLKALLQLLTIAVGVAAAGAVAAMAWQAHEEHGLAIQAFSVPPEFAQRGLTGQVVAARVLDRLSQLQADTISARPATSYANDWGDDIKVEIPETGVSIGELNRWLRQWLGHETMVSGEVVRAAAGVSVTARTGAAPGGTVQGAETDIDALISQAAEALYSQTQPYRYAVYLASHGKPDEALAAYAKLARSGSPEDQRWAYSGRSELLLERGDNKGAETVLREGLRRGLSLWESGALANLNNAEDNLKHSQGTLDALRLNLREAKRTGQGNAFVSNATAVRILETGIHSRLGDFRTAASNWRAIGALTAEGGQIALPTHFLAARTLISNHDVAGARASSEGGAEIPGGEQKLLMAAAQETEDWARFIVLAERAQTAEEAAGLVVRDDLERSIWPSLAVAYAHVGRQAEADALVAKTPLDCDPCVEARALVAAAKGDWAGAGRWFAVVDRQAPEIPSWDADWGQALLVKGDVDGAVARLALAHRKGPHFADPQELWGEALMKKGDFKGAVEKFAAADKDAPRWGRNHLHWGEALAMLGKAAEVQAQ